MSIFKFLKHYYETRQIEYDWYQDIYEVVRDCSNFKGIDGFVVEKYKSLRDRYEVKRKEKELPKYLPHVLDCFVHSYPQEWLDDGITKETMDRFDISYSISQNKIIIPHYDLLGRLVGIRGRALNEWEVENIGKYAPIQIEGVWYKHPLSMNLYGLDKTYMNVRRNGICYLFESEKSVLQMNGFSMPNCSAAVCGSNFNKYQLNILMKFCAPSEIVICFDKEEKPGEDKYFYKLYNMCKKYGQYCNFSFIYDREGLLNLKESPTDRGEEVFKKLLEKRVRVK
jgi:DNA primase